METTPFFASLYFLLPEAYAGGVYYDDNDYDVAYVDCYGDVDKVDLAVLRLRNPTDKRVPLQIKNWMETTPFFASLYFLLPEAYAGAEHSPAPKLNRTSAKKRK